jgi:hypothetical protein
LVVGGARKQPVRPLNARHGRVDVEVSDRFVQPVAVEFLVLDERFRHRLHRRPSGDQRLARDLVEAIDLAPDCLVCPPDSAREYLLDGPIAVALLRPREGVEKRAIVVGQDRETDFPIEVARTSSDEKVFRGEAREVNLRERGRGSCH